MRFRRATSSGSTAVASATPMVHRKSVSPKKKSSSSKKKRRKSSVRSPLAARNRLSYSAAKRPPTMKSPSVRSPSLKRHKSEVKTVTTVAYPTIVDIPTRRDVQVLYENAVVVTNSHQRQLDEMGSGLLSLEDVLLPAVAEQENKALKRVQSKVQRDDASSSIVKALELCRRAVYESVAHGIASTKQARMEREAREAIRDAQDKEQCRIAKELRMKQKEQDRQCRREERAVARKMKKERRKLQAKKNHPQNVELWREVAILMTELGTLQKQERLWKEAEHKLMLREKEVLVQKQQQQNRPVQQDEEETTPATHDADMMHTKVEQAIDDITLSTVRIQSALQIVSDLMEHSDAIRKDLYRKYAEDHQFHGYKGVKDPKALIRAMAKN